MVIDLETYSSSGPSREYSYLLLLGLGLDDRIELQVRTKTWKYKTFFP